MKYMLLIYSNPATRETLSKEMDEVAAEVGALMKELTESGEWIGGEALADETHAKSVRVRDGVPTVTDGPFVEAKEFLGGYCLFDCDTPERAEEIAARWPDARLNAVELRPLMNQAGTEM